MATKWLNTILLQTNKQRYSYSFKLTHESESSSLIYSKCPSKTIPEVPTPPSPIIFAIMAADILGIPPLTTCPPSGFPESKRHSGKLNPAKLPPPFPVKTIISYVDDVSITNMNLILKLRYKTYMMFRECSEER
jgi:hypothetical protein